MSALEDMNATITSVSQPDACTWYVQSSGPIANKSQPFGLTTPPTRKPYRLEALIGAILLGFGVLGISRFRTARKVPRR